jgi:hypothetical protein
VPNHVRFGVGKTLKTTVRNQLLLNQPHKPAPPDLKHVAGLKIIAR